MARIIVAEDDTALAERLQSALMTAGHGVGVLDNGEDALKVIRSRHPDLVILDCQMPKLSGIRVLEEMRKSTDLWDTPAMMLAERRGDNDVARALYAGANDFVKKPVDADELVFRAEGLLEHSGRRTKRAREALHVA
ncbi:hypothetical protein GCM10023219_16180 [Stakelama sediminis]|uniref:DNA-binding response OmpR family regulator n=1 Tax=Stakelama sediminis TaxID=463200 RepID=A0A840YXG0_9SPHN|nr:response regulator transcription factor [Stakelama sediminis]MBB5718348.1 DNA-binding response OmpR family regulator [Stakelama sediminis]